jgi:hypothetical protein
VISPWLLALRPAFEEKDRRKLIKQVTTAEPPRLDRLNPEAPRDLVTWYTRPSTEDPRQRYASAAALAADLLRFAADEPIQARPVGLLERLWRWSKRNPIIASLSAAVLLLALVASIGYVQTTLALSRERLPRSL